MPDLICVAKDGLRFGKIKLAYGEAFHTNRWKANQIKSMFPDAVVVVGNATDEKVAEVLARFEEAIKPKRGRPSKTG